MLSHTTRLLAFVLAVLAIAHALPELARRSPKGHTSHHNPHHHGNNKQNNNQHKSTNSKGGNTKETIPVVPNPTQPKPAITSAHADIKPLPATVDMGDASQHGNKGKTASSVYPEPLKKYRGALPKILPFPVDVFNNLPTLKADPKYPQCNIPFKPDYHYDRSKACYATTVSELNDCVSKSLLIVMENINVKPSEIIDLKLQTNTRLFVKGTITLEYRKVTPGRDRLMTLTGSNILFTGFNVFADKPERNFAVIDGQGAKSWDGKGDNGSLKGKMLLLTKFDNSIVSHLTFLNAPVQATCISESKNSLMTDIRFDNIAGDNAGKNTDFLDVNRVHDSCIQRIIGYTQDDLIDLNSGSNIVVQHCIAFSTHGFSIGVRNGDVLNRVLFYNNVVFGSMFGYRVKVHGHQTGTMSAIYFINNYAFDVRQYHIGIVNYLQGTDKIASSSSVKLSDIHIINQTGTGGLNDVKLTALKNVATGSFTIVKPAITGMTQSLLGTEFRKYVT